MKKILGLVFVAALLIGGVAAVKNIQVALDPGTGGHVIENLALDPGTGGHVIKPDYDPGTGGH
jgi:hypothetical protein